MHDKSLIQDLRTEQHYIHLAADGAPALDVPVMFADEASRVFCAYRDAYDLGASEMEGRSGYIYNSKNQLVGRISYNGRVWDATGNSVE